MIGDKLASGAASAVFTGPKLKFDEAEMRQDLRRLPAVAFCDKYMVTAREYELMLTSDGEQTNALIRDIQDHAEAIERLIAQDKKQDESLRRDVFIKPFAGHGISGRVLVSRDQAVARQATSKLALPRHLRKERERLPTTGHVLDTDIITSEGEDARNQLLGKRVLFGPMSGTPVCFNNYPTWILLDVAEILALVNKEDAEVIEEELEPLS